MRRVDQRPASFLPTITVAHMPAPQGIPLDDLTVHVLDGPPEWGFDCGRADQTEFLYERAWEDQQALLSVGHLPVLPQRDTGGIRYVCIDALPLSRRERGEVRYQEVGALKLAQLGVHRSFQGRGLGRFLVADIIGRAHTVATRVGCRYVTLDSQPDMVSWYEELGFKRNQLRQDQRVQNAVVHGRDPEKIAVSMRFDLRA